MARKPVTGDEKLDQALELLREASNDKKAQIKEYVSDIFNHLRESEQRAVETVKGAALSVDEHVHAKPWIYIAAAALGGLVCGLICHRRGK